MHKNTPYVILHLTRIIQKHYANVQLHVSYELKVK